jgi:5-methylcytosine-specific restriction endonuclease McrA
MSFFAIAIRNSKNRGAGGNTTVALLEAKMAYYGYECRYCGANLDSNNRSLDHAIPLSRGGTNWTANFIPCCRTCNSRKRGKTFKEFFRATIQQETHPHSGSGSPQYEQR